MTDEWQKEIFNQRKKLKLSLEALKVKKKRIPDSEQRKVEALTKELENILKAIDEDKSKGVHNFIYAKKLMSEGEEKVLFIQRSLSKQLE